MHMIPDGSLTEKKNQINHFLAPAINQPNTPDELPLQPHKRPVTPVGFACVLHGPAVLPAGAGAASCLRASLGERSQSVGAQEIAWGRGASGEESLSERGSDGPHGAVKAPQSRGRSY